MTLTLAFYKGRSSKWTHRLQDALIRFATNGTYSHVEMILGRAILGGEYQCYSSSGRDSGVRCKAIELRPESWDLVELNLDPSYARAFIQARIGAPYDYLGLLLSHVISVSRHSTQAWFCSEIIAAALQIDNAHQVSPQMLFDIVTWHHAQRGEANAS